MPFRTQAEPMSWTVIRLFRFSTWVVWLLTATTALAQQVPRFTVDVTNETGFDILSVYIFQPGGEIGRDLLGKKVMELHQQWAFTGDAGVYRVRFTSRNGRCETADTNLTGLQNWTLDRDWFVHCVGNTPQPAPRKRSRPLPPPPPPPTITMTLNNQSHFTLIGVYIAHSTDTAWGRNLAAIQSGASTDFAPMTVNDRVRVQDGDGDHCDFTFDRNSNVTYSFSDNFLAGCFAQYHGK